MYKLENGALIEAPRDYINYNGKIYTNPTNEQLFELGYKPLVVNEIPEEKEGYFIVPTYKETATEIINDWEVVEIPNTEN